MRVSRLRFLGLGRAIHTLLLLVFCGLVASVRPAEAIPAWARKYDVACSQCHTAWPKLNAYGRDFKLAGYRIPGEAEEPGAVNEEISDFLTLDRTFPLSARGIMRPFDKRKNRRAAIRSFHEVELLIGGRIFNNVSGWVEAEAEDEDDFNLFIEQGVVGFHPREEANIVFGWGPPFWADPFDSLADGGRRMTRSHKGPLDQRFTARERLRSESQWIGFYGRAQQRVFYNAGVSSGGGDPEGRDALDGYGRLMVEAAPGVYLGGFVLGGTNETQAVDLAFRRIGFDFQIERGGLNVYGMVLNANDDFLSVDSTGTTIVGGDVSKTVGYVEGFYIFKPRAIPMIVPLIRLDFLDERKDMAAVLNFYFAENIKAYFEWWQNVDTPGGLPKDNRATVQVDFVF